MKYLSIDRLADFEFHDAVLTFAGYDGHTLVLDARELNIHKATPQNQTDCDLEILLAHITLEGFSIWQYDAGRIWKTDAQGVSRPVTPPPFSMLMRPGMPS